MNEFINKFLPLERGLFLTLNETISDFWDNAMWTYTGIATWLPMMIIILYVAIHNQQLKEVILVLASILLVFLLSNLISGYFFKPVFQRYRPSHHPDYRDLVNIVNGFRGGDYGFISGHATNSFALAFFFLRLFKNRLLTIAMILWATLNSYSRIYLGVHFISDIVAGFIVGTIIGLLVYEIYIAQRVRHFNISLSEKRKSIYSQKRGYILGSVMISYITLIIIFSPYLTSFSHSIIPKSWF